MQVQLGFFWKEKFQVFGSSENNIFRILIARRLLPHAMESEVQGLLKFCANWQTGASLFQQSLEGCIHLSQ